MNWRAPRHEQEMKCVTPARRNYGRHNRYPASAKTHASLDTMFLRPQTTSLRPQPSEDREEKTWTRKARYAETIDTISLRPQTLKNSHFGQSKRSNDHRAIYQAPHQRKTGTREQGWRDRREDECHDLQRQYREIRQTTARSDKNSKIVQEAIIDKIVQVNSNYKGLNSKTLDVHGLHRDEVECAVGKFLEVKKGIKEWLTIIVGKGLHSSGGKAVLKTSVLNLLDKNGLCHYIPQDNVGEIQVLNSSNYFS